MSKLSSQRKKTANQRTTRRFAPQVETLEARRCFASLKGVVIEKPLDPVHEQAIVAAPDVQLAPFHECQNDGVWEPPHDPTQWLVAEEHSNNQAPEIQPIDDQEMPLDQDTLQVDVVATDAEDPADTLTYCVRIETIVPADVQLAYDLNQQYTLSPPPGTISENEHGFNERYIQGQVGGVGSGFYILPNGEFYLSAVNPHASIDPTTDTLIAVLPTAYYDDTSLLHNAQLPPDPHGAQPVLSEGVLTLDPAETYQEDYRVYISVSDGVLSSVESFAVYRQPGGLPPEDLIADAIEPRDDDDDDEMLLAKAIIRGPSKTAAVDAFFFAKGR